MQIQFAVAPSFERYSPTTASTDGIGGSEHMAIELAFELAARGHEVTVFAECFEGDYFQNSSGSVELDRTGVLFDSQGLDSCEPQRVVRWLDGHRPLGPCDLFVSSRLPQITNPQAKARAFWAHDLTYGPQAAGALERFDHVIALTDWHASHLKKDYPNLEEKLCVIENALPSWYFDDGFFAGESAREGFFFASSPDRGLDEALQMAREAGGKLHVLYGFKTLMARAKNRRDVDLVENVCRWQRLVETSDDIVYHGRVSRLAARSIMRNCIGWLYPTTWLETSCLVAMEALACGCRIHAQRIGGLIDTLGGVPNDDMMSEAWRPDHHSKLARERFYLPDRIDAWEALATLPPLEAQRDG